MNIIYAIIAYHAYLLSIFGNECDIMMKNISSQKWLPSEMQNIHGCCYILSLSKIQALMTLVLVIGMMVIANALESYSLFSIFIIIGILDIST